MKEDVIGQVQDQATGAGKVAQQGLDRATDEVDEFARLRITVSPWLLQGIEWRGQHQVDALFQSLQRLGRMAEQRQPQRRAEPQQCDLRRRSMHPALAFSVSCHTLGKAAFHLASLCSPLIFLALALRRAEMLGDRSVLRTAVDTGSPLRNFFGSWRSSPWSSALRSNALKALAVLAMLGTDIGAWKRGSLPLTALPLDLFSAEKRPLLVMLYTTFMQATAFFVVVILIAGLWLIIFNRFFPNVRELEAKKVNPANEEGLKKTVATSLESSS